LKKLYTALFSAPLFTKVLSVALVIAICSISTVKAQYYGGGSDLQYGVSVGADYDAPVGNFAYTFKPAINYNLNLLRHDGNFTSSISFGYHVYKPKMDTFYYAATSSDYGTVEYQNFTVVSFYLGGTYDYPVSDQLKVYAGVNFGVYSTHLAFQSANFLEDDNEDLHEQNFYLAGRLGFTYMLTDNVGVGIEAKYNFFTPAGDSEDDAQVGTTYFTWSAGLRLTYNF
jgi:hypothetical protein